MDDKPIRIENLNLEQIKMLNKMNSMASMGEYEEWLSELKIDEALMVCQLAELTVLAIEDHYAEEDLTLANNVLKKFML